MHSNFGVGSNSRLTDQLTVGCAETPSKLYFSNSLTKSQLQAGCEFRLWCKIEFTADLPTHSWLCRKKTPSKPFFSNSHMNSQIQSGCEFRLWGKIGFTADLPIHSWLCRKVLSKLFFSNAQMNSQLQAGCEFRLLC